MKHKFIAIIPARYASTRFPGKPLALLGGKPIIQHVYGRVSESFDYTVVATDDVRISDCVKRFGGNVVMTGTHHKSGTDRCMEAYSKVGGDFDVVVNVQGDEPFIHKEQLEALKQCFEDVDTQIATLVKPFEKSDPWEKLENPNSPKVVVSPAMYALYFSRSVVPYTRNYPKHKWLEYQTYYKHIGLYGYTAAAVAAITRLEQTPLELSESLEQLRWLENGYKIKVGVTRLETIGIDTLEDLVHAEAYLTNKEEES